MISKLIKYKAKKGLNSALFLRHNRWVHRKYRWKKQRYILVKKCRYLKYKNG